MAVYTAVHRVKKGLDLPIAGAPEQRIDSAEAPPRVALVAADYVGMRPKMRVEAGDPVRRGQLLFEDKKKQGVRYTAPAEGRVAGVHRGERRALRSVVIELDREELSGRAASVRFAADTGKHPRQLSRDEVRDLLLESGLWTALRARPYGKVVDPSGRPEAVFVTAIDTNPLAPDVATALAGREEHFERGVAAVAKLTDGPTYVCTAPGTELPLPDQPGVRREEFDGPHPAGTVGVHIHTLRPVHRERCVWYLGYQDAVAIGKLFAGLGLDVSRVVSLAGPAVRRPRLLRTRIGASLDALVEGELAEGEDTRVISGSVLSGRTARGDVHGYLGRYHEQVSALPEDRSRELLGWLRPGAGRFSVIHLFASSFLPRRELPFTTAVYGSDRAIVPLGLYERVFPLDIPPTALLRAVVMQDAEKAEELGALELEEEDLALCSFVDPGKHEFGPHLRQLLTTLEKEG